MSFFFLSCGSQSSGEAYIFILLSVNVRANSKDLTTEEMRKLIERSVKWLTHPLSCHALHFLLSHCQQQSTHRNGPSYSCAVVNVEDELSSSIFRVDVAKKSKISPRLGAQSKNSWSIRWIITWMKFQGSWYMTWRTCFPSKCFVVFVEVRQNCKLNVISFNNQFLYIISVSINSD